nr:flagellar biosynthesis anti-sigma factor FlgM [Spirochaetales bacterium]
MKLTDLISQVRTDNKIDVIKTQETAPAAETSPLVAADRVEISEGSKEVLKMQEIVKNTPSVRTGMVDELKRQVESGEYNVAGTDIADKMLESWI